MTENKTCKQKFSSIFWVHYLQSFLYKLYFPFSKQKNKKEKNTGEIVVMSSVVPDTSTIAEDSRCRKPRNQPISETDPPNPQQIPWNTIQSTRPKSSISSLLLSTTKAINTLKKMNFTPPASLRRLGCVFTVSSQVTERETPANWEGKKKQKQRPKKKSRVPNQVDDGETNMNASSSVPASSVVVPDVGCGPGIGLGTDAAAVDCVVSTRPISATERVDADKMNQRQVLCTLHFTNRLSLSQRALPKILWVSVFALDFCFFVSFFRMLQDWQRKKKMVINSNWDYYFCWMGVTWNVILVVDSIEIYPLWDSAKLSGVVLGFMLFWVDNFECRLKCFVDFHTWVIDSGIYLRKLLLTSANLLIFWRELTWYLCVA